MFSDIFCLSFQTSTNARTATEAANKIVTTRSALSSANVGLASNFQVTAGRVKVKENDILDIVKDIVI